MYILRKLTLKLIKMNNLTLLVATLMVISIATISMYLLEPDNFGTLFNSLYWVLTTFSTVGYGDYSPQSNLGKLLTMFYYLIGIGLLGIVIGKVVDFFGSMRRKREEGRVEYKDANHVVIIGWSKKSQFAIQEILQTDQEIEIILIDMMEKAPASLLVDRVHYIQGDPAAEETLRKANIAMAKAVIIFADDKIQDNSLVDGKSLIVSTSIGRLAPDVHTTVEIMEEKHIQNFSHVHVDDFILSHETISHLAVRSAFSIGITNIYSQLMSQKGDDLFEIKRRAHWKTYRDAFMELLNEGATLIADGNRLDINRRLDEPIPEHSRLYVIADKENYSIKG